MVRRLYVMEKNTLGPSMVPYVIVSKNACIVIFVYAVIVLLAQSYRRYFKLAKNV